MDDPSSFSTSLCLDLLEELDGGERSADSQLNGLIHSEEFCYMFFRIKRHTRLVIRSHMVPIKFIWWYSCPFRLAGHTVIKDRKSS